MALINRMPAPSPSLTMDIVRSQKINKFFKSTKWKCTQPLTIQQADNIGRAVYSEQKINTRNGKNYKWTGWVDVRSAEHRNCKWKIKVCATTFRCVFALEPTSRNSLSLVLQTKKYCVFSLRPTSRTCGIVEWWLVCDGYDVLVRTCVCVDFLTNETTEKGITSAGDHWRPLTTHPIY